MGVDWPEGDAWTARENATREIEEQHKRSREWHMRMTCFGYSCTVCKQAASLMEQNNRLAH